LTILQCLGWAALFAYIWQGVMLESGDRLIADPPNYNNPRTGIYILGYTVGRVIIWPWILWHSGIKVDGVIAIVFIFACGLAIGTIVGLHTEILIWIILSVLGGCVVGFLAVLFFRLMAAAAGN